MKFAIAGLALFAVGLQAHAVGRLAQVQVVDRDSGETLQTHYYKGEYWVAGRPGDRYAISVQSHESGRLLAVVAVDGVNVITGETASWSQTGYVYNAAQCYEIDGWRKSHQEVAAFQFAQAPHSYAERTGRPANVGVIGVALFEEYTPPPSPIAEAASAPPATQDSARASASSGVSRLASPLSPKLGTGYGEREASFVQDTDFVRRTPTPREVIRIRYDSLENLIALGVIRQRVTPPPDPNPFPGSDAGFVPDPPGD